MSLKLRIDSIGVRSRVARWTPADSISIARMPRAVDIHGKSTFGSFTSRSLEAIGPALNLGGLGLTPLPWCSCSFSRTSRCQVLGPYNFLGAQWTAGLRGNFAHQSPNSASRALRFATPA